MASSATTSDAAAPTPATTAAADESPTAAAAAGVDRKLSDLFDDAYTQYESFERAPLRDTPQLAPAFQLRVAECTALLETATRLVSAAGLFADNETEDEIATEHLRYLLLPYFLGQLVQKRSATGQQQRADIVRVADVYFK